MSTSTVLSLTDFTAYELPTKTWMRLVRPKLRLRVRVQNRAFVSSAIKVARSRDEGSKICWAWDDEEGRFSRPSFADDDVFEVEVERRFLLWYKCIRRTKPMTLDQVRTGDHCALSLYDGQVSVEALEDRIEIGEITFSLHSDVTGEDASFEGKPGSTTYL